MHLWWNRNKKKIDKTPRELMREKLAEVCTHYDADRDSMYNAYGDILSLVCFVNDDFPSEKQTVHTTEAIADFMFVIGHCQDSINWVERKKLVGKRENCLVFRLPADHMQNLYGEHISMTRAGKRSPLRTTSILTSNGVVYPVAFCLGFLWGSQSSQYAHYPSSRI